MCRSPLSAPWLSGDIKQYLEEKFEKHKKEQDRIQQTQDFQYAIQLGTMLLENTILPQHNFIHFIYEDEMQNIELVQTRVFTSKENAEAEALEIAKNKEMDVEELTVIGIPFKNLTYGN